MDEWTIKSALEWTEGYLAEKGDESPRVSAQWLLSEATGLSRTHLFMSFDQPLTADERATLRDFVRRRGAGEPLQYITGEVTFRHIPVKVRPGVLIPRPETEVLVSEVLAALPAAGKREARWNEEAAAQESEAVEALKEAVAKAQEALAENQRSAQETSAAPGTQDAGTSQATGAEGASADEAEMQGGSAVGEMAGVPDASPASFAPAASRPLLVADLCTGSGCIACSLAYEHPEVRVIATDIAPEAVALARENVEALGLADRVAVLECSLGAGIGEKRMGTFDAVVSNPPYVPTAVLAEIPREVADHEPALALDGGADGLSVFLPLCEWAARALRPGGVLACELYEDHLDAAAAIAQAHGFESIRIVNDLTNRPRILTARKPAL
ncbi:class I SAM-dependent methyltransferase [uncultured Adlercreutzia sp.]|uniref:N5-glutamine methyltransferase family protein n=1 Tax=uncultured Adlercreutzia sp. TaxID=875803 RepID=UPI00350F424B